MVRLIRAETTHTVNGSTEEELTVTDLGVAFNHPTGLASDEAGNLYVSDTFEGAVRVITPEGNVSTLIDGLADPMGLCWMDGTLYIAETGANRIVKVTDGILTVVAGSGEDGLVDGAAAQAASPLPRASLWGRTAQSTSRIPSIARCGRCLPANYTSAYKDKAASIKPTIW